MTYKVTFIVEPHPDSDDLDESVAAGMWASVVLDQDTNIVKVKNFTLQAQAQPPEHDSTWPEACPICGAEWAIRSKTMGKANRQPHEGRCAEGHWWYE